MTRFEMSAAQYRGEGSEADWRKTVKECAVHYGWEVLFELPDKAYATLAKNSHGNRFMIPVMNAISGQPDLLLGHRGEHVTIAVELKVPGEKPKPHQQDRLDAYEECGTPAFVWETGTDDMDRILSNPDAIWEPVGEDDD